MQKEFLMICVAVYLYSSLYIRVQWAHAIGAFVELEAELIVLLGALLQKRAQLLAALLEAALLLLNLRVRTTRSCCALPLCPGDD